MHNYIELILKRRNIMRRQKERPYSFFKNLEDREETVKGAVSKEEKNAAAELRQ